MDLQELQRMLRIDKGRLEYELEAQAEVMYRIIEQVNMLAAIEARAADDLKRAEANLFATAKSGGDSDKLAEMYSRTDPIRTKAWERLHVAKSAHAEWAGMLDAWRVRGFSLRELVALYEVQYFSSDVQHNVVRAERPQPTKPRTDYTKQEELPHLVRVRRRVSA
jgi:hypothetical protein